MRDYARALYKSKTWQSTRAAYASSVGGMCELCMQRGIYTAGVIVHHKQPVTPQNIGDANITLSWDNLQLLCRDCHAEMHKKCEKRYKFDESGRVIASR